MCCDRLLLDLGSSEIAGSDISTSWSRIGDAVSDTIDPVSSSSTLRGLGDLDLEVLEPHVGEHDRLRPRVLYSSTELEADSETDLSTGFQGFLFTGVLGD